MQTQEGDRDYNLTNHCGMFIITLGIMVLLLSSVEAEPRPSTLPLGHGGSLQYSIVTSEQGRNIVFL